jgi:hypothetical protein
VSVEEWHTVSRAHCRNLLDREHFNGLSRAYEAEVERLRRRGVRVPVNTPRGAHFLDRLVVDEYCGRTAEIMRPFRTVRGCFPEGEPIYAGSKILDKAHVQVAVRDLRCLNMDGRLRGGALPESGRGMMADSDLYPGHPEVVRRVVQLILETPDDELLQRLRATPGWDEAWLPEPGEPSNGNSATTAAGPARGRRIVVTRP